MLLAHAVELPAARATLLRLVCCGAMTIPLAWLSSDIPSPNKL